MEASTSMHNLMRPKDNMEFRDSCDTVVATQVAGFHYSDQTDWIASPGVYVCVCTSVTTPMVASTQRGLHTQHTTHTKTSGRMDTTTPNPHSCFMILLTRNAEIFTLLAIVCYLLLMTDWLLASGLCELCFSCLWRWRVYPGCQAALRRCCAACRCRTPGRWWQTWGSRRRAAGRSAAVEPWPSWWISRQSADLRGQESN